MAKIRIKQMAQSKGYSMSDIYYGTGIAESTLSRINNGKLSPSLDTLQRVADFLKCSITDLFCDEQSYVECPHCHKLINVRLFK